MRFEFDPEKSAKNEEERGLPFDDASRVFDASRMEWQDERRPYGEVRFCTLCEIEGRVFFCAFTRRQDAIRIISFRKANAREIKLFRKTLSKQVEGSPD